MYKENPKTKNSGIHCVIPQTGTCPNRCEDCFFQSGRSYLEPLEDNLPNMPPNNWSDVENRVFRINDGNDSNVDRETVMEMSMSYPMKFYNTAIMRDIAEFEDPVVLTINPGHMTDESWHKFLDPIPANLMFVRIRTNSWNIDNVVKPAIEYYINRNVPVVLTFMAYYDTPESIPLSHKKNYVFRKRTLNSYFVITTKVWEEIMEDFKYEPYVYSCSKVEGDLAIRACARCGNCIREYFVTMERMRNEAVEM